MRKAVLSVVFVLLSGLSAYAQGVSGGVKIGAAFANINFDPEPEEDFDGRIGLAAGGFVTLPIGPVFAIQPEALVVQRGTKVSESGIDSTFRLTYLEFPIFARIGTDAFNVFGGPSFGVKLNADVKVEGEGTDLTQDIDDDVKGSDIGIVVGVGFGGARVTFDARLHWGLTDINDDPTQLVEAKNKSFMVMFGFKIG